MSAPVPPAPELVSLQAEIACPQTNRRLLAARVRRLEEWVETFSAPIHKRAWWWLQGFRWKTLGRWYPPEWRG